MKSDIEILPSEDKKKVTLVITGDKPIGVQGLIRILANFIKHLVAEHGLEMSDHAVQDSDKVTKIS